MSYEELQRKIGFLIHQKHWKTRTISKTVAKVGAWLQDLTPGDTPFIKPWMIDLASDHYELDISLAKKRLSWNPSHSLRETLPKMIERLKVNPRDFYEVNKLEFPPSLSGESRAA